MKNNKFNPQISQMTRITLISLRAMRNLQGSIPRGLPRGGSFDKKLKKKFPDYVVGKIQIADF
jgi:hypothetical protein